MNIEQGISSKPKFIYYLFLFIVIFSGQTFSQNNKNASGKGIIVSLAKKYNGTINIADIIKDPVIRLEKFDKKYIIKSFSVGININGEYYDQVIPDTDSLSQKQIDLLQTAKKEFNQGEFRNKIYIEEIIAIDADGNKIDVKGVMLFFVK
ncbi:MAG: hypothetical protein HY840_09520 [Bacteroidetes bacterium]|nr:hypothetical protein [Bacteroidota bacterium]